MEPFKVTLVNTNGATMKNTHFHESHELFFLLEGTRDFFINNHTYTIKPGDVVFINPKIIHRTMIKDHPYVKRYAMMIPKEFINTFALAYEGNLFDCFSNSHPILQLKLEDYPMILSLFERIYHEYKSNNDNKDFIISILVTELLFYLTQLHKDNKTTDLPETKTLSRQVIDLLVSNYSETITLDDISKELFVNTYHICRTFKQETGFTVMEYLTYYRLKEAMRLLDTTNQSVTDIGFLVGFNNINHFIRIFRQNLNTTPKQYQLKRKSL